MLNFVYSLGKSMIMKLKVVVDLNISQRKVLQSILGKSKGIKPVEYKEVLLELISNQISEEGRKQILKNSN